VFLGLGYAACYRYIDYEENIAPGMPYNPFPIDRAIISEIPEMLTWECNLLEGDSLTSDLYLGLDTDPPLILSGVLANSHNPGWIHQKEARDILLQIYFGEQKYFDENDSYWGDAGPGSACRTDAFSTIDVQIPTTALYTYTIVEASSTDLLVRATCGYLDDDALADMWTIDENGQITADGNDFDNPAFYHDTTYYWKIVTKNKYGDETEGPVWSFSTAPE